MTSIVERFTFATSMTFSGNTLYVVNNGLSALAPGEVWSIPDFSLITPIPHGPPPGLAGPSPAAPAANPASGGVIRSGVTAPNTGTGPDGGDRSQWWLLVFALGALGLSAFGAVTAMKRP